MADRPRDYQQKRLYRADDTLPDGRRFRSEATMRREVQAIVHSRWWKARFPHIKDVAVDPGRPGEEWAFGDAVKDFAVGVVRLSDGKRTLVFVLHELAHTIIEKLPYSWKWSIHGPQYVGVFLSLMRKFAPKLYPSYRLAYTDAGLRFLEPDDVERLFVK